MITNYKADILSKLSKQELLNLIDINGLLIEKLELDHMGATISEDTSGPDGYLADEAVEIKAQIYQGNFKLLGRGKYGSPSEALYNEKIKSNEVITLVGSDQATGEVYYRFEITFDAIASYYKAAVRKGWGNYDLIPLHYMNHDSFKILYVADKATLQANSSKFQPKFLRYLYDVVAGEVEFVTNINNHYYK